jgi:hypothetical protein
MITINNQNVEVEFAKDKNNGVIAVRGGGTTLSLQQLKVEGLKLGESWKDGDEIPLPKVNMEFYNVESVDVMIKMLEIIKKNLRNPYGDYALAC